MESKQQSLFAEIEALKKQKRAIVLAHYYQDADIQDIADYIGDSLELSRKAASTDAEMIVFAGVHFMAETAKILNPSKKVVVPDLKAGCSLADSCPPEAFRAFKQKHPGAKVVSYINCSAEIKALSDYICTSSNAAKIVSSIPRSEPIIFAPDKNLGAYLSKTLKRPMILWSGSCIVHEMFSHQKLERLKAQYPDAKVIAHPECEEPVLAAADFVGSTSALLQYTQTAPARRFIVVTEAGILHQMKLKSPDKEFIPAPPENTCACNECPHMRLNTLEKIRNCMRDESPELNMGEELRLKALIPLERMLKLSQSVAPARG